MRVECFLRHETKKNLLIARQLGRISRSEWPDSQIDLAITDFLSDYVRQTFTSSSQDVSRSLKNSKSVNYNQYPLVFTSFEGGIQLKRSARICKIVNKK